MTNVTTLPSPQNSVATSSVEAPATQASAEPANAVHETVRESLQHLEDALHNPAVISELAAQGKTIDLDAVTQATEAALEHDDHAISRFDDDGGPHPDVSKPPLSPLVEDPKPSAIVMGTGPGAKPVIETELGELVPESSAVTVSPVAYDTGSLDALRQQTPLTARPSVDAVPMSKTVVDAFPFTVVAEGGQEAPGTSLAERVAQLEATVIEFRKIMDHHGLRGPQS